MMELLEQRSYELTLCKLNGKLVVMGINIYSVCFDCSISSAVLATLKLFSI